MAAAVFTYRPSAGQLETTLRETSGDAHTKIPARAVRKKLTLFLKGKDATVVHPQNVRGTDDLAPPRPRPHDLLGTVPAESVLPQPAGVRRDPVHFGVLAFFGGQSRHEIRAGGGTVHGQLSGRAGGQFVHGADEEFGGQFSSGGRLVVGGGESVVVGGVLQALGGYLLGTGASASGEGDGLGFHVFDICLRFGGAIVRGKAGEAVLLVVGEPAVCGGEAEFGSGSFLSGRRGGFEMRRSVVFLEVIANVAPHDPHRRCLLRTGYHLVRKQTSLF